MSSGPASEGSHPRLAFQDYRGTFSALDHHLAHALGAFACSTLDEAAVFAADRPGDVRLWGTPPIDWSKVLPSCLS
jgi:predicted NodU family carbamoyl transferase